METGRFARHRRLHGGPAGEWVSAPALPRNLPSWCRPSSNAYRSCRRLPTDLSASFRSPQRSSPRWGTGSYTLSRPQQQPLAMTIARGWGRGLTPTLQVGVALNRVPTACQIDIRPRGRFSGGATRSCIQLAAHRPRRALRERRSLELGVNRRPVGGRRPCADPGGRRVRDRSWDATTRSACSALSSRGHERFERLSR
jgi:hypothetical protein